MVFTWIGAHDLRYLIRIYTTQGKTKGHWSSSSLRFPQTLVGRTERLACGMDNKSKQIRLSKVINIPIVSYDFTILYR